MKRFIIIAMCLVLFAVAVPIASAQHNYGRNRSGRNAIIGAGIGAVIGAIIGANTGRSNRNRSLVLQQQPLSAAAILQQVPAQLWVRSGQLRLRSA